MLYSSRDLYRSNIDEITRLLENASYLTEQECIYYPEMVPIRENTRLNRNIIRLEDFVDYSLANGITDGGYSLAQICEASNVPQESIVFSVDEVTVLEDYDMEDTVRRILDSGHQVYASPISENNPTYIITEAVMQAVIAADNQGYYDYADQLFEAYIEDDFDTYLSEDYIVQSLYDSFGDYIDNIVNSVRKNWNNARHFAAEKASAMSSIARKIDNNTNECLSGVKERLGYGINHLQKKLRFREATVPLQPHYGSGFSQSKANQLSSGMQNQGGPSAWQRLKNATGFGHGNSGTMAQPGNAGSVAGTAGQGKLGGCGSNCSPGQASFGSGNTSNSKF